MWDELFRELGYHWSKYFGTRKRLPMRAKRIKSSSSPALDSFKDFVLICQEDIFHPGSRRKPILLLSKGQEISTRDLPKLIMHGVQPEQFRFKPEETEEIPFEEVDEKPFSQAVATAVEKTKAATVEAGGSSSIAWRPLGKRRAHTVVILESDPKILKRLIDCLFVCGYDLNKIHPVGVAANLAWTLERYKPDLLIGCLSLLSASLNAETLKLLPPQLVMTVPESPGENSSTEVTLNNGTIAYCLYKPITRFALRQILLKLEPEAIPEEKAPITKSRPKVKLSRRAMLKMG
jgi:hypothetical protein